MEPELADQAFEPREISLEYFSKKENKTTRLINNSDPQFKLDGMNRWYSFDLNDIVYIESIEIYASGYSEFHEFECYFSINQSNEIKFKLKFSNGIFTSRAGVIANSFRFSPGLKLFGKQEIMKVRILGYTSNEIDKLSEEIFDIKLKRSDLEKQRSLLTEEESLVRARVVEAEQKEKSIKDSIELISRELGQSSAKLDSLKSEISSSDIKRDQIASAIQDLEKTITSKRDENRNIESKINDNNIALKTLVEKIKLFPSEISGFREESGITIRNYLLLSIPFVATIVCMTFYFINNVVEILKITNYNDVNVINVIAIRIPFVIVSVTILQVCGYVVAKISSEIININNQRLSLSKLSIVAKDVSTASAHGLEIDPEKKFELETALKMDLLREYMKNYVSSEYRYKKSIFSDLLPKSKQAGVEKAED